MSLRLNGLSTFQPLLPGDAMLMKNSS